jgi:hypothetical protein
MARIPVYEQRTSAVGPSQLSRVSPAVASGAGLAAVGQAVGDVSRDLMQVKLMQEQQAEQRAAVWATEKAMSNRSEWVDRFRKMQASASEDGTGFQASVLEQFDSGTEELLQQAPTSASRDWLREQLGRQRLALQEESGAFEQQRGTDFKVGGIARAADAARISAQARPQDFDTLAAELTGAIAVSGLSPKVQATLREKSAEAVAAAAVTGMIDRDPHGTLKQLNQERPESRAIRVLNYDQRQALRREAETEIARREAAAKHEQAEAKQALGERVRDAVTAYRLGLDFDAPPARADFIVALGKEDGDKAYENFTHEQQLGADLQVLATMPPQEQAQLLAKRAPTGSEGVAESAERFRVLAAQTQQLNRQRDADPAAYVTKYSDKVRAAFAQADQSPEAAQSYATAALAEQRRLGVKQPRILPDEVASSIAGAFNTATGEQLVGMIQTEETKWGSQWPRVFGELAAKKMPASALAIGRGMAPGPAVRLASIAALPMEELQKGIPDPPSDVREAIVPQMADFQRSLDGVIGGERTFADMYEAVQRLTYSYVRQGVAVNKAAKRAYSEVLGDHYAFRDANGHTFRVPIEQDSDAIEIGAQAAMKSLPQDLQMPVGAANPNLYADYVRAIGKHGYWVTSVEGENGLTLFLDGAPVLRGNGSTYSLTWDQLRALTANERAQEAARSRSANEFALKARSTP